MCDSNLFLDRPNPKFLCLSKIKNLNEAATQQSESALWTQCAQHSMLKLNAQCERVTLHSSTLDARSIATTSPSLNPKNAATGSFSGSGASWSG